jgi:hypothetical protein
MIRPDLKREPHWLDLATGALARPALHHGADDGGTRRGAADSGFIRKRFPSGRRVKALGRLAVQAWGGGRRADNPEAVNGLRPDRDPKDALCLGDLTRMTLGFHKR